jgi:hypothetical protein
MRKGLHTRLWIMGKVLAQTAVVLDAAAFTVP